MSIKENLDLMEENKELRKTIRRITQELSDSLVNNPKNVRDDSFNKGIEVALHIVERECGVSIAEILDPRCR